MPIPTFLYHPHLRDASVAHRWGLGQTSEIIKIQGNEGKLERKRKKKNIPWNKQGEINLDSQA